MNVLDALKQIASDSVDCIVTSPPYYGLRSYGKEAEAIWDEKAGCEHDFNNRIDMQKSGGSKHFQISQKTHEASHFTSSSSHCIHCNAWKGQLGLEPTYQLYLQHLLQITLELKRVLKPSGTMWWHHVNRRDNAKCWLAEPEKLLSSQKVSSKAEKVKA
jgi:site-specific DNA-methyltransferase (adenine-specific)